MRVLLLLLVSTLPLFGQGAKFSLSDMPFISRGEPLLKGLAAYWKFNETGTNETRLDSFGGHHLTPVNVVNYGGGKVGNDVRLNKSSYPTVALYDTNRAALSDLTGSSMTVFLWKYKNANNVFEALVEKSIAIDDYRGWRIFYDNGDFRVKAHIWDGATTIILTNNSYGYISTDARWYGICLIYDAANQKAKLCVDTYDNTMNHWDEYTCTNLVSPGGAWLSVACNSTTTNVFTSANQCVDIDEVGIWRRALTTNEVNRLYNTRNGKTYPFR